MKILHTARPPDVEAPVRTRRMFVRDLALDCLIGVHRYERDGRQRVRVNLSLDVLETGPVERDRLAEVVNYDTLVVRIRALAGTVTSISSRLSPNGSPRSASKTAASAVPSSGSKSSTYSMMPRAWASR